MGRDIYEVQDRDSITVPIVLRDSIKALKSEYNFTPTTIELHHLKKYAEMALNNWQSSPEDDFLTWEYAPPTSEAMHLFFLNLYDYDIRNQKRFFSIERQEILELLRRKQEQAHMAIDFSTDLETRTN